MSIKKAFKSFMANFEAVDTSANAVELFEDGSYRLLSEQVSESHGLILEILSLDKNEMENFFQEHWDANQNVQSVIARQDK